MTDERCPVCKRNGRVVGMACGYGPAHELLECDICGTDWEREVGEDE